MIAWLFSDMFERFPNLKIALSEGNIGWMPYFIERAEQVIDKQRHWAKQDVQMSGRPTRPRPDAAGATSTRSTCVADFRDHIYGCFIEETHGCAASTSSARTT